jgi:hypothetical protein
MPEKGITLLKASQASPDRPYDPYFSAESLKASRRLPYAATLLINY